VLERGGEGGASGSAQALAAFSGDTKRGGRAPLSAPPFAAKSLRSTLSGVLDRDRTHFSSRGIAWTGAHLLKPQIQASHSCEQ